MKKYFIFILLILSFIIGIFYFLYDILTLSPIQLVDKIYYEQNNEEKNSKKCEEFVTELIKSNNYDKYNKNISNDNYNLIKSYHYYIDDKYKNLVKPYPIKCIYNEDKKYIIYYKTGYFVEDPNTSEYIYATSTSTMRIVIFYDSEIWKVKEVDTELGIEGLGSNKFKKICIDYIKSIKLNKFY
ncbi:hypothetical protein [Anaerofustis stercorihominis]|uniref:hypothetical protein n=1 Tax=Anaerofustis stercorihominis TaxID=214853 RepID=UPI00214B7EC3|nr:hypothetical protein [Anaerofustis stercorihominis]MCR2033426.1 hypothetical protein [Anaerofustis stercorihominis]